LLIEISFVTTFIGRGGYYMDFKIRKILLIIIGIFVAGVINLWIGFAYGEELGSHFSRPIGASGWTVSNGLVDACTYIPIIIGVSFILLAMIFCTLVFKEWIKKQ
jgi:hypothetical protein